ncbi:MAG: hypothetical protein ACXAC7_24395 [Candidatus Hodarchaeales archaeon]|jgi:hypothetical protein
MTKTKIDLRILDSNPCHNRQKITYDYPIITTIELMKKFEVGDSESKKIQIS